MDWLTEQISLIRPKLIVCQGRIAAKVLIKDNFKITAEHGVWFDKGDAKIMAIYHPAALLRDPGKRPETFVDLKELEKAIKETCRNTVLEY